MIQFSVVYNINGKLRADGKASIAIRAYYNKRRKYFSTGILIKPRQWSKRRLQVIDHPNAIQINTELRRQLTELEAYTLKWIGKHGSITLEQLEGYFKYEGMESFTKFWTYEFKHDKRLSKETRKKHKTAFNYWTRFRSDVKFSELNFNLIQEFDNFLFGHGLKINTVHTHHKQVKKYINLAIKKELLDASKNPYLRFTPKLEPTQRVVLSTEEITQMEELTFTRKEFYLELIRDMFLFSCYTGLRFADVCSINHGNIQKDKEGLILNINAQKTKKQLLLPLYKLHNSKPEKLIQKHSIEDATKDVPIFHQYTNQYFNRTLKELAQRANIQKPVTSHIARHTFATHLASKVPIHILKAILQHSKIETTMIYLHLSNAMVNDALDGVDW